MATRRRLQYDFNVAAGADPGQIQLNFQGADQVSLDPQGNLIIQSGIAQVAAQVPKLYQEIGGIRQAVEGHYVLVNSTTAAFAVGTYDTTVPLVIDPTLTYSTYLGGNSTDFGLGVAVDSAGSAYLTGQTSSTNFPVNNSGSVASAPNGATESGSTVTIATSAAHNLSVGQKVTIAGVGVAGYNGTFTITSIPTANTFTYTDGTAGLAASGGGTWTLQILQGSLSASNDVFITKLNAAGTATLYSTYLGGTGDDRGYGIAVDAAGNAYATGVTSSSNFPTTASAPQKTFGGGSWGQLYLQAECGGQCPALFDLPGRLWRRECQRSFQQRRRHRRG